MDFHPDTRARQERKETPEYSVTFAVVCLTDPLPDESICFEFRLPQQKRADLLCCCHSSIYHRNFLLFPSSFLPTRKRGKQLSGRERGKQDLEGFGLRVPACRANWIPVFLFCCRTTPEKHLDSKSAAALFRALRRSFHLHQLSRRCLLHASQCSHEGQQLIYDAIRRRSSSPTHGSAGAAFPSTFSLSSDTLSPL